jgi:hypothetical protein
MATCHATDRIMGIDESNILAAIIAAVSLGALGLVVAQMSVRLDASDRFVKTFGFVVALSMWASSVVLVLASLWRHYLNKRGLTVKRTDLIFYASVAAVMFALVVAMLWFAFSSFLVMTKK